MSSFKSGANLFSFHVVSSQQRESSLVFGLLFSCSQRIAAAAAAGGESSQISIFMTLLFDLKR
jgi:hypothetical protein